MKKTVIGTLAILIVAHLLLAGGVRLFKGTKQVEGAQTTAQPVQELPPPDPTNAKELLERFTLTVDTALSSFIIKTETTEDWDISFSGEYEHHSPQHNGRQRKYELAELRGDWATQRGKRIREPWGGSDHPTRADRGYMSFVYDGARYWTYSRHPEGPRRDRMFYRDDVTKQFPPGWPLGPLETLCGRGFSPGRAFGYLEGDDERVDTILTRATSISVRDELETVHGVGCHVIDATTNRGEYTLWLDPEHGYNIAKAAVFRKGGDDWHYKMNVPEGCGLTPTVDNVRFEQFDGVWIPVEGTLGDIRNFDNGDYGKLIKHYKVLEFVRNPDHEALGSFLPDDIREGAIVHFCDIDAKGPQHRWKNGKPVKDPTAD